MNTEAMRLALEAVYETIIQWDEGGGKRSRRELARRIVALAEQPAQDNTYGYAKRLAEAIFKQHFASDEHYASGRIVWGVKDTVIGILTQIDNMVADMVRRPAQQEPVAWMDEKKRIVYWHNTHDVDDYHGFKRTTPLYEFPPPQRTWVGLTEEERSKIESEVLMRGENYPEVLAAIEAKLKEKNA